MLQTQRKILEALVEWDAEGGDGDMLDAIIADARTVLEPEKQPTTQGEIMAQMFSIRDQRREIAQADKELTERYGTLEALMIAKCDEHGATRVSSPLGTAVVSTNILPQAVDWDAFYQHIKDTDGWHLLQRRIATAAFRESLNAGIEIPGLTAYEQRTINLRSA